MASRDDETTAEIPLVSLAAVYAEVASVKSTVEHMEADLGELKAEVSTLRSKLPPAPKTGQVRLAGALWDKMQLGVGAILLALLTFLAQDVWFSVEEMKVFMNDGPRWTAEQEATANKHFEGRLRELEAHDKLIGECVEHRFRERKSGIEQGEVLYPASPMTQQEIDDCLRDLAKITGGQPPP